MGYFFPMDKYYIILVLPAFLFALYTQFKVKGTFNRYRRTTNLRGMTGAQVARAILDINGLNDVSVQNVRGELTDHYDPKQKIVRLSDPVYSSTSVSALGVAAHETGHALQHKDLYAPLGLRSSLVPVAGIGSSLGPYMAIFGLIFRLDMLVDIGIILFTLAVAFYIITLPVEFNASKRAIAALENTNILTGNEIVSARKVLNAAALTYVASATVAVASLLRLILLAGGRRND